MLVKKIAAPKCTGLKEAWTGTLETSTQFPVNPGTVVELACSHIDAINGGSSEVTCTNGTSYAFTKEPSCLIPGLYYHVSLSEQISYYELWQFQKCLLNKELLIICSSVWVKPLRPHTIIASPYVNTSDTN